MSIKSTLLMLQLFLITTVWSQEQKEKKKIKEALNANLVMESDNAYQLEGKEMQKTEFILKPEVTYKINKKSKLILKGQLYNEFNDNLEASKPEDLTASDFSKRHFIGDYTNFELRELYYYTKISKNVRATFGKQQIVWGETDGLKLLDVINPQNFREFVLDDFEDSRIPLWSIKTEFDIKELGVQVVWVPDNTYHITQDFNAPYFTQSLFPKAPEGIKTVFNKTKKPNNIIKDSDVGMRLTTFKKGWDLSFNYFYYYDDLPVFYTEVQQPINETPFININPEYERLHLMGATFNKVFGSSTVRGEVAYIIDQYFSSTNPKANLGIARSDWYKSAIGIDYIKGENMISVQLFTDLIMDDIQPYNRDVLETNTSLLMSREMMNDNLKAEVLWVHNANHGDGFLRPKVSYWLNTSTQLFLSSDVFYGNKNKLYGQFQDQSRISTGFKWGI